MQIVKLRNSFLVGITLGFAFTVFSSLLERHKAVFVSDEDSVSGKTRVSNSDSSSIGRFEGGGRSSPKGFQRAEKLVGSIANLFREDVDLSPSDLREIIAGLSADQLADEDLVSEIAKRWIALDADGARDFCLNCNDVALARAFMPFLVSGLATRDPEATFSLVRSLPQSFERREGMMAFFRAIATLQPGGARYFNDLSAGELEVATKGYISGLAVSDLEVALKKIDEMVPERDRKTFELLAKQEAFKENPQAYIETRLEGQGEDLLKLEFGKILPSDLGWIEAHSNVLGDQLSKTLGSDSAAASWLTKNFEGNSNVYVLAAKILVGNVSGTKPLIESLKSASVGLDVDSASELAGYAVADIFDSDAASAINLLTSGDGEFFDRKSIIESFSALAAEKFPLDILESIDRFSIAPETQATIGEAVVDALAPTQGDQMLEILREVNLPLQVRQNLINKAIREISYYDPTLAGVEFHELPESSKTNDLAKQIVSALAQRDLDAAVNWAESLSDSVMDGDSKTVALLDGWMKSDAYQAVNYVKELEDGPVKDEAIQTIVSEISGIDRYASVAWAAAITDTSIRRRVLLNLLENGKTRGSNSVPFSSNTQISPQDRAYLRQYEQ